MQKTETKPPLRMSEAAALPRFSNHRLRAWAVNAIEHYGIALLLIPLIVVFGTANPNFLTTNNALNVAEQVAVFGIMGVGMTIVILMAEIDLSVGSIVAMSGVVGAQIVAHGGSMLAGVLGAMAAGAGVGILNGVFVVTFGLPSLLVTLGTLSVIRGLGYVVTGARPVIVPQTWFANLGNGDWLGVPIPVWLMGMTVIFGWFLLANTRFGRHVYAVGGNREVARRAGIRTRQTIILGFMMSGLLSGLAGIISASRLDSGQPIIGQGYELSVIAATVLGGTSLFGGRGTIIGTIIGAFIIGVLHNGLDLLTITPYWQTTTIGGVVLLALVLDAFRLRKLPQLRLMLLGQRER